jgi:ABC-type Fe3+/spermidine/putrescine transport system ATPase subunit
VLKIESVSKQFRGGNYGVRDVSLDLKSGVIGLLGPNGAGKTTLMQMIATITRPSSGRILFEGVDVARRPNDVRRKLGYLPQDFGVYENLTAIEFYLVVNDRGANRWFDFAGFYRGGDAKPWPPTPRRASACFCSRKPSLAHASRAPNDDAGRARRRSPRLAVKGEAFWPRWYPPGRQRCCHCGPRLQRQDETFRARRRGPQPVDPRSV